MNEPKTKFGKFLLETVSEPEAFADRILPLAAIAESIATRGQGRNMAQEQQQSIYSRAARIKQNEKDDYQRQVDEETRTENARNRALEKKKIELELSNAEKKAAYDESERKRLDDYRAKVAQGADPVETWKATYPETYSPLVAKPKQQVSITTTMKELGTDDPAEAIRKIEQMNQAYPDYKITLRPEGVDPFALEGFKAGLAKQTATTTADAQKAVDAQEAIDIVKLMRNHPGMSGAVGMKGAGQLYGAIPDPVPGSPEADFRALEESFISLLTLGNMGKIKGVLSDTDMKILRSASSMLNHNTSEKQYLESLRIIQEKLQKAVDKGAQLTMPAPAQPSQRRSTPAPVQQTGDKFTVGQEYTDGQGNRAIYRGNGQWEEVK